MASRRLQCVSFDDSLTVDQETKMDNNSIDMSIYHFTGAHQEGLAPLGSFDHTLPTIPSTTVQLAQSYGISQYIYPKSSVRSPNHRKTKQRHSPQILTWRLDPDESLSDWTLTVVSNPELNKGSSDPLDGEHDDDDDDDDDDSDDEIEKEERDEADPIISPPQLHRHTSHHPTKKYFVHRTQLAVGPRRSDYFAKLFRNGKKRNKRCTGTRIELRPSAAAAFPAMLDFLYSSVGTPPNTTTETAVALRHLATCFGIRELFDSVTEFIKLDLSPDTAPTYLLEASAFSHEKLYAAALQQCAHHFESIKFSRIVTLTPQLLEQVVMSPLLESSSRVLSSRVASYCRCRPGLVDATTLHLLTHPDRMPEIASEESLFFLHLIAEVDDDVVSADLESLGGRRSGGKYSLYNRCLVASAEIVRLAIAGKDNKKKSSSRPTRNAVKEYYSLPAVMRVDLLEHALLQSPTPEDLQILQEARKEVTKKYADENDEQLHTLQGEMEKMRRKYEKKLASREARIATQEQEISAYARELSKFVRVPNEHVLPSVTSEHTFAQVPEFDEYGELACGEVPPTALPRFGNQREEDGWVCHETRRLRNGQRGSYCWPMYIYKGE
mmetsp:Transcript_1954/g.3033  ORF Transcript_1954/g.3033 Transcript_1954/m.3033 type:complete len:609 (-) Transcript_1954:75-1901(-)